MSPLTLSVWTATQVFEYKYLLPVICLSKYNIIVLHESQYFFLLRSTSPFRRDPVYYTPLSWGKSFSLVDVSRVPHSLDLCGDPVPLPCLPHSLSRHPSLPTSVAPVPNPVHPERPVPFRDTFSWYLFVCTSFTRQCHDHSKGSLWPTSTPSPPSSSHLPFTSLWLTKETPRLS